MTRASSSFLKLIAMNANMTTPAVFMWSFRNAPEHLQQLSPHGGDEDWIALVPPGKNCGMKQKQPGGAITVATITAPHARKETNRA